MLDMSSEMREEPGFMSNARIPDPTKMATSTHRKMESLKNICRPIIYMFKVTGLVWREKEGGRIQCCTCYSILVQLSLVAVVIAMCHGYYDAASDGPGIVAKITIHAFYIQVLILSLSGTYKYYKHFYRFVQVWDNYKTNYGGLSYPELKRKLWMTVAIVNITVMSLAISLSIIFSIYPSILIQQIESLLFTEPPRYVTILLSIYILFAMCIWLQPCLMICNLGSLVASEFTEATNDFRTSITESEDPYKSKDLHIEDFRLRHLALCDVCGTLDNVTSFIVMLIYVMDLASIVALFFTLVTLNMYDIDHPELLPTTIASGSLSVVAVLMHISFITYVGSQVAVAAKSSKSILLHIDARTLTSHQAVSVELFLHKVTHDHIGLTLWKMVKVDKTVFLTMVAMIVAYLAMLLKFAIALKKPTNILGAAVPQPCTPCNLTSVFN